MANELAQELGDMLSAYASDLGITLGGDMESVRDYAAERMAHLAMIVGQAGYQEAVKVEAINVALMAAGSSVRAADLLDQQLVSLAAGALSVGARALTMIGP